MGHGLRIPTGMVLMEVERHAVGKVIPSSASGICCAEPHSEQ